MAETSMVGYIRVSTDEQGDSGLGLEAQRQAIRAECERRGWSLDAIYADVGYSGKTLRGRTQLGLALAALREGGAAGIVVAKLDRLSRSMLDFAGLVARARDEHWNIVALDVGMDLTSASGELVANVLASVAQWERQIISQRTRDALAIKRATGVRLGGPVLVPHDVAKRIVKDRRRGLTLQQISDRLNKAQVATPRGGLMWRPSTLTRVLRRESAAVMAPAA